MLEIYSVLLNPNLWLDLFIDTNKTNEKKMKILNYLKSQKCDGYIRDAWCENGLSFVFEYKDWEDIPSEIRNITSRIVGDIVPDDDVLITTDFMGLEATISLFDISPSSDYSYESCCKHLGPNDKKFICFEIEFYEKG